jgi:hypothetical protein
MDDRRNTRATIKDLIRDVRHAETRGRVTHLRWWPEFADRRREVIRRLWSERHAARSSALHDFIEGRL